MTSQRTQHAEPSAAKMAAGLKFAALAVVLALIVVITDAREGMLTSGRDRRRAGPGDRRPDAGQPSEYYPAHFAAPTTTTELPPEF